MDSPDQQSSISVLRREFDDFEDLRTTISHWNLDFTQTDAGTFQGSILQLNSKNVLYANAVFGRKLHQQGVSPAGFFTVAIPATENQRLRWHGFEVRSTDIMIFPHDGVLDSVSDENFHVYTFSLSQELLAKQLEIQGLKESCLSISGPIVLRCQQNSLSHLRQLLEWASMQVDHRVSVTNWGYSEWLLDEAIPAQLIRVLSEATSGEISRVTQKRRDLVARAVMIIQQHAQRPISVEELCEETGVSIRTLQYAFRQCLNTTPKSYIQAYRLQGVRTELLSDRETRCDISEIANRWGFWHMGDFARVYREFFEVNPSETIRLTR